MTVTIKHKFTDPHADGPDGTLVRPSNWNDTHTNPTYTATQAGAVSRALDVKIGEPWVSVKDFGAVGDDVNNDTTAIQAALDSGAGAQVNVFFPPGTYKIYPPNATGVNALKINFDNVTMLLSDGATIKFYVSGGRDPNTNFDTVLGAVWRGSAIWLPNNQNNFAIIGEGNARITGQCLRQTSLFPYNSSNPAFPADPVTGNGWDVTNHAVFWQDLKTFTNQRLFGVKFDSFRGEILNASGVTGTLITQNCTIAETNADGHNAEFGGIIANCEIFHCSQAIEFSPVTPNVASIQVINNYIHDNNNGFGWTIQTDLGTSAQSAMSLIAGNTLVLNALYGIFLQAFVRNVQITNNIIVDCNWGGSGGAAVNMALDSATNETACNVWFTNNRIGSDQKSTQTGIKVSDQSGSRHINSVWIWDNVFFNTPAFAAAVSPGAQGTAIDWFIRSGSIIDIARNAVAAFENVGGGNGYNDEGGGGLANIVDFGGVNAAGAPERWTFGVTTSGQAPTIGIQNVNEASARAVIGFDGSDNPYVGFGGGGSRDIFMTRIGAAVFGMGSAIGGTDARLMVGGVQTVSGLVTNLPAAGNKGTRRFVTDATATLAAGLGNIVAGGGGNNVPIYDDGTNWRIG